VTVDFQFCFQTSTIIHPTRPPAAAPTSTMNVTHQQLISQILDVKHGIRHGLLNGDIKAIMKEKKGALVSDWHPTNITMPLTANRNNYLGGKKWIFWLR
jgi:hypothetical protein